MSGEPEQHNTDARLKPLTLALAGIAVAVAGIMPAMFSFLPKEAQPRNLSIIGA